MKINRGIQTCAVFTFLQSVKRYKVVYIYIYELINACRL